MERVRQHEAGLAYGLHPVLHVADIGERIRSWLVVVVIGTSDVDRHQSEIGRHGHRVHVDVYVAYEREHVLGRERHVGPVHEFLVMLHVAQHDRIEHMLGLHAVLLAYVHTGDLPHGDVLDTLQDTDVLLLLRGVRLVIGGPERGRIGDGVAPGRDEIQGVGLQSVGREQLRVPHLVRSHHDVLHAKVDLGLPLFAGVPRGDAVVRVLELHVLGAGRMSHRPGDARFHEYRLQTHVQDDVVQGVIGEVPAVVGRPPEACDGHVVLRIDGVVQGLGDAVAAVQKVLEPLCRLTCRTDCVEPVETDQERRRDLPEIRSLLRYLAEQRLSLLAVDQHAAYAFGPVHIVEDLVVVPEVSDGYVPLSGHSRVFAVGAGVALEHMPQESREVRVPEPHVLAAVLTINDQRPVRKPAVAEHQVCDLPFLRKLLEISSVDSLRGKAGAQKVCGIEAGSAFRESLHRCYLAGTADEQDLLPVAQSLLDVLVYRPHLAEHVLRLLHPAHGVHVLGHGVDGVQIVVEHHPAHVSSAGEHPFRHRHEGSSGRASHDLLVRRLERVALGLGAVLVLYVQLGAGTYAQSAVDA